MPLLQLSEVSLAYGHVPLLDHADLVIEAGEHIGLIGRNGTGKSTLAQELARRANFAVIRSDVVRKELAPQERTRDTWLYTEEWNQRTYAACLDLARGLLGEGKRVLVDATFRTENQRHAFFKAARMMPERS